MKISNKLLYSVFPILSLLLYIDVTWYQALNFELFNKLWILTFVLAIVQIILLIRRIIKSDISSTKRAIYIVLILSFVPFHLYYVWIIVGKNTGQDKS